MTGKPRNQSVPLWVAARLKRQRELRGWTLRDLEAKCGISYNTVLRAERGRDVALSSVIAITAALGMSLDTLVAEPACVKCDGHPPEGFICAGCGLGGVS